MDLEREEDYPTPQCFRQALEFLERNGREENWHLHLECFDPHEPFLCPSKYRRLYGDTWDGRYHFDWPNYQKVEEEPEAVEHIRKCYAGTLSMADAWLGKLLDNMDQMDLWKDTALILTTDHGHLLGEHGYWAKNYMFDYRELVHIPLVVCAPGLDLAGRRVKALTTTMDLMPTLLELHGAKPPEFVHGRSLAPLFHREAPHHDAVLYGYFGKDINLTDGRYTYCRQPLPSSTAYHYTAVPLNHWRRRELLRKAEPGHFLPHTHGLPVYRIPTPAHFHHDHPDFNPIYDLEHDPRQERPIRDAALEARLAARMKSVLERLRAPASEYARVGL
jgi:arylsulfatase A-like enzyme